VNTVEKTTKPEAPNPATTPRDIIETEPSAAALEADAASTLLALWAMPEGVVPSKEL